MCVGGCYYFQIPEYLKLIYDTWLHLYFPVLDFLFNLAETFIISFNKVALGYLLKGHVIWDSEILHKTCKISTCQDERKECKGNILKNPHKPCYFTCVKGLSYLAVNLLALFNN